MRNRNYARWIEYSISSSVMMMLIAMLPGITDVVALIGIFSVNAAMISLLIDQDGLATNLFTDELGQATFNLDSSISESDHTNSHD